MLNSSREDGNAFVSTSSLDGEKNLKKKVQSKNLQQVFPNKKINEAKIADLEGIIECIQPDKSLDHFNG